MEGRNITPMLCAGFLLDIMAQHIIQNILLDAIIAFTNINAIRTSMDSGKKDMFIPRDWAACL